MAAVDEQLAVSEVVEALVSAAEIGLASIHHAGDWLGEFHEQLPNDPAAEVVRRVGAGLLRQAVTRSMTTSTDLDVFRHLTARNWNSVTADEFNEVVQELSVNLMRVIDQYERAQSRFAPGVQQELFPVRSSFKSWTNNWVLHAASKVRRFRHWVDFPPVDPHHDSDQSDVGILHRNAVATSVCLSPDMLAITYKSAGSHGDNLQLVEQVYRTWLLRLTQGDASPRATVRAVLIAANPYDNEDAISKRVSRQVGNIAYGVARLISPSGEMTSATTADVAVLGWRLLELEGCVQLVAEACASSNLAPARRDARLAWLHEVCEWVERLSQVDDRTWRNAAEETVREAVKRLKTLRTRCGDQPLFETVLTAQQDRLEQWLSREER